MSLVSRLILGLSLLFSSSADTPVSLTPSDQPIPATYFGMHIHRATNGTPWPAVPFGAWRLWDSKVTWPDLEPARGQWNFTLLDKEVSLALAHQVEPIVPLALSPTWASARPQEPASHQPGGAAEPANMADWRNYVRTLGMRYKGRVFQYEIWNEPNVPKFYSGSISTLVDLTREAYTILHGIDPSILVISPSYPGFPGLVGLDQFLAQGGGNYCDVIGFHLYVTEQPPGKNGGIGPPVKGVLAPPRRRQTPVGHRGRLVSPKTVSRRLGFRVCLPRLHLALGRRRASLLLVRLGQSRVGNAGDGRERQSHGETGSHRLRHDGKVDARRRHEFVQLDKVGSLDVLADPRRRADLDRLERIGSSTVHHSFLLERASSGIVVGFGSWLKSRPAIRDRTTSPVVQIGDTQFRPPEFAGYRSQATSVRR